MKEFVNILILFWYYIFLIFCMYLVCKYFLFIVVCLEVFVNYLIFIFWKYLNYGLKSWFFDNKEVNGGYREVNKIFNVRVLFLYNGGLCYVN